MTSAPGPTLPGMVTPMGCGEPRGPGGGGVGGGGDDDAGEPAAHGLNNDIVADDQELDCSVPPRSSLEKVYCASQPPSGVRYDRTVAALNRIASRGTECANIASWGFALLSENGIRYYRRQSGWGDGYGGPLTGVLLNQTWVDKYSSSKDQHGRSLDYALAHEIEHAMGRFHENEGAPIEHTEHAIECGG